jgi:hypothetical protein
VLSQWRNRHAFLARSLSRIPSRVYVIELDRGAGHRRDPRIPWLYVGSTGRRPETRFEQHKRGYKSAGIVKRHWRRLRPELYEDLPAFRRSGEALEAELERARELAGCGFIAHCDGTSYGKEGGDWTEWGRERLEPVIGHLDAAIAELAECSFEPLSPDRCADLLHGVRQFWVRDCIDQEDPPPAYSRFSHVRRDVLLGRVIELTQHGELRLEGGLLSPT